MATVYALKRVANKAHNISIPDTDAIISRSVVADPAGGGGAASLWSDSKTTTISIGTGSTQTAFTIGGGAAYAGTTLGKSGVTDTLLGDLTVNGSLKVNGTVTTVNATSITTQDQVLTIALTNRSTAPANAVVAVYRGNASNAGATTSDALVYWNDASVRFDIGYGGTGASGGTLPSAPTTWADLKLNNLKVGGTSITADAGLTVSATAAALTLQTTSSGAINLTSAGAIVATSSGTSSWNNTSGNLTLATLTSGTLNLNSAAAISSSATTTAAFSATTTMTITGTTALNLTASGSSDITLTGRTQAYTFNDASNVSFSGGITATSIVGAINQVFAAVSTAATIGTTWTNLSGVNAIAQGSPVFITTTASKIANSVATADNATAQVFGFPSAQIAISGSGTVIVEGVVQMLFQTGDTVPANGAEIFLSAAATSTTANVTSSYVTGVAPSSTGNVVQSLGFLKDNLGTSSPFAADTLLAVQIVRGSKSVV